MLWNRWTSLAHSLTHEFKHVLLLLYEYRSKKALRNKLFLKFIIAVLFLANVLVFVSKVKRKRGGKNPDAYF
jgi:hypothetical protein